MAYRAAVCNQKGCLWFIGSYKLYAKKQGPNSKDEKGIGKPFPRHTDGYCGLLRCFIESKVILGPKESNMQKSRFWLDRFKSWMSFEQFSRQKDIYCSLRGVVVYLVKKDLIGFIGF